LVKNQRSQQRYQKLEQKKKLIKKTTNTINWGNSKQRKKKIFFFFFLIFCFCLVLLKQCIRFDMISTFAEIESTNQTKNDVEKHRDNKE